MEPKEQSLDGQAVGERLQLPKSVLSEILSRAFQSGEIYVSHDGQVCLQEITGGGSVNMQPKVDSTLNNYPPYFRLRSKLSILVILTNMQTLHLPMTSLTAVLKTP